MSDRKIGSVTKTLIKARDFLSDEENWCVGQFHAGYKSCAHGALFGLPDASKAYWKLAVAAERMTGSPSVWKVNDDLGHESVLQMYDLAIQESVSEDNS